LTVEFDVDAGITEESVSQVESTVSADQANADSPAASTEESNAGSDGTGDNELDSLDEEWWQT
jgi:hypothetical protein